MKLNKNILGLVVGIFAAQAAHGAIAGKSDGEFVTLSGTVSDVKANSFMVNVDGRKVLVEMDDYGWDADGYKLMNGDQVVVSGQVDKDFLEKKKVEAGSVYVKNLDTHFFANSADEEGAPFVSSSYTFVTAIPTGASVDVQGKVTKISGRQFTVDTGLRELTVDTSKMIYNPLDGKGFTKIQVGDRVRVSGRMDTGFYESNQVAANYVNELSK